MAIGALGRRLPEPHEALPGRDQPMVVSAVHLVTGASLVPPFPAGTERAIFGMGCFWGAERRFWEVPGVVVTAVGYAGGFTPNPTYEEVCTGRTGHAEVVLVVYDPTRVTFGALLRIFWEGHDPTQGMRQGPDLGTQYRSVIYCDTPEQQTQAEASRAEVEAAGRRAVTTEVAPLGAFYYAEPYHQQYLARRQRGW